jgi:hypothetical protein
MKARHLRPTPRAIRVGRALTVPVVALAALSATAPAMAAKPSGGSSSTATASCVVNPNPVTVNSDYTLSVSGLAASEIVNVLVSDSQSTRSWVLQADASGTTSVVGHAYWTGTSNVTVQKQVKHNWTVRASCSFSVV